MSRVAAASASWLRLGDAATSPGKSHSLCTCSPAAGADLKRFARVRGAGRSFGRMTSLPRGVTDHNSIRSRRPVSDFVTDAASERQSGPEGGVTNRRFQSFLYFLACIKRARRAPFRLPCCGRFGGIGFFRKVV